MDDADHMRTTERRRYHLFERYIRGLSPVDPEGEMP